jgi:sensor domain CHASE-containing protein
MFVSHVILIPCAVLVARRKSNPSWLLWHISLQFMAALMLIIGFSCAFFLKENFDASHFQVSHSRFGIFILAVHFFVVPVLGFQSPLFYPNNPRKKRDKKDSSNRSIIWMHRWLGYFILFASLLNIILGAIHLWINWNKLA